MLFTIGISVLVGLAIVSFSIYTGQTFAGMMNYIDLQQNSRRTLDRMLHEVRRSKDLTSYTAHRLDFIDVDSKPMVYEYSPSNQTLSVTRNGVTEIALERCQSLLFEVYQRTPMSNSFSHYPANAGQTNGKVVQVSWTCSRTITGTERNTESVQTAKIVIRNK